MAQGSHKAHNPQSGQILTPTTQAAPHYPIDQNTKKSGADLARGPIEQARQYDSSRLKQTVENGAPRGHIRTYLSKNIYEHYQYVIGNLRTPSYPLLNIDSHSFTMLKVDQKVAQFRIMLYNALNPLKAKSLDVGKYADGHGLWLIKRTKLAGKWMLRLVIAGKRREMGLGPWPDVSIAEARERAAKARRDLRDGIDPIAARAEQRERAPKMTLEAAIAGCFAARQAELKNDGQAGRWMSPLSVHIIPTIGSVPVEHVDQILLRDTLAPIWHEKPSVSVKALNRIGLTLKHAAALGLDVDLQAVLKTRALLGKQRFTVTHIPSLPYGDVPKFFAWLKAQQSASALALQFLILTAARTSEVRFARFDELEGDTWVLAPERTKTGHEHRIPLSKQALDSAAAMRARHNGALLFPNDAGKALSDAAMSSFLKREGYDARPHGFRATFRTWVEEMTDTPYEVKETALGHRVDTKVVQAYQRSDRLEKRRVLMQSWADYLHG